ncbi:MAG: T9SS type A sorting domain-containing protein [Bacteroidota bacterium]
MNKVKVGIICLMLLAFVETHAQKFFKNENKTMSFVEMQRQFDTWKKGNDLHKQKNWKYFKRWEADMEYHTDAHGKPVDPAIYFDAIAAAINDKNKLSSSSIPVTWLPTGPFNNPVNNTGYNEIGTGRINCIAFHPSDPLTYFVGVAQGGLWKTTNNGQSWIPLTDNLPITRVSDIAINPLNPDEIYISLCDFEYMGVGLNLNGRKRNTHYGMGVFKTMDGGITWTPTGLSFQLTDGDASLIRKIIIHPTNTSNVVACGASGMYTSSDAGGTWNHVLDSLFWDMTQDPVNPDILYAATGWVMNANDGEAAIYKSTNFGLTWTKLTTGIPPTGSVQRIRLAVAPSDPNYIYAITVDDQTGFYGFYKSTDAGTTWQFIPPALNILASDEGFGSGGQGNYDLSLYIDPADKERVITGGVNIWGSVDGAQTFNPVSHWTTSYGPSCHADVHSINIQPLTGNIFACTDGGLYRTPNIIIHSWVDANNGIPWPTQWTKLNDGRQVSSLYRLASSRNLDGSLVAGAQDNSTYFYSQANSWTAIFGGDGMDNYINPLSSSTVVGSSQYGNFNQSFDEGLTSSGVFANINNEVAEWTSPIIADYNIPGLLYIGFENVVKSADDGFNWTSISAFPTSGFGNNEISALAVSNTNSTVLYAAKRVRYEYGVPGSMYRTLNGGVTWQDVTPGIPDSIYYTSVEINNARSNEACVSMAGFTAGSKVYRTSDNGNTWQNISYNLPNLPVNCVKSLPGGRKLLAATDIGIYELDSGTTVWNSISNGLPNVIISDIEINSALNKIYISTFGRGIWETDLNSVLTSGWNVTAAEAYDVNLYPSVNNGTFTLQLNNIKAGENVSLSIIDIMGKQVYAGELHQKESKIHVNLPSGKYFAKVYGKQLSGVKSFVVQ